MVNVTLDEYITFYHSTFLPAFAKYTGYLLEKDEAILTSVEYAHSHLMQYFNHPDANEKQQNLSKAKGHLERATLDCYKLLWAYIDGEIQDSIIDPDKRLSCIKMREEDILTTYRNAKKEALTVRLQELRNVGINIEGSIHLYLHLISLGEEIMQHIDPIALSVYEKRKKRKKWREYVIGILIGIISSAIVTLGIHILSPII